MTRSNVMIAFNPAPNHCFPNHPECPERVNEIEKAIYKDSELQSVINLVQLPSNTIALDALNIHDASYIYTLRQLSYSSDCPRAILDEDDPDGPTYITPSSFEDALNSATIACCLVDKILQHPSPANEKRIGLSFCRPPGHHATQNAYMGFCLLNNIAIAGRHAKRKYGIERICIIDFDVHHGNGTQDIFYNDDSVLFIDMHRDGVWPGTGKVTETGGPDAQGTTLNVPLPAHSGHQAALEAFHDMVLPALQRYRPQFILVSAGFDAHYKDPLENLRFENRTYHALAGCIVDVAEELCDGKVLFVLEGGYHVESLGECAVELTRAVCGLPSLQLMDDAARVPPSAAVQS